MSIRTHIVAYQEKDCHCIGHHEYLCNWFKWMDANKWTSEEFYESSLPISVDTLRKFVQIVEENKDRAMNIIFCDEFLNTYDYKFTIDEIDWLRDYINDAYDCIKSLLDKHTDETHYILLAY